MKKTFAFLIFCFLHNAFCRAQTIHTDDDKILYKDTIQVNGTSGEELLTRARYAIPRLGHAKQNDNSLSTDHSLAWRLTFMLPTIDHAVKEFEFDLKFSAGNGAYQYKIDSVILTRKVPGVKTTKQSAKELLKGMESSGAVAMSTEKDLNEIDMYIQKFLDGLNSEMKKPSQESR